MCSSFELSNYVRNVSDMSNRNLSTSRSTHSRGVTAATYMNGEKWLMSTSAARKQ